MISQIDILIKNLEKKEKVIDYIKNVHKVEVGTDIVIPDAYIDNNIKNKNIDENNNQSNNTFNNFEEKLESLNLPSISDKNIKQKIAKLKKEKDTKFLIRHLNISCYGVEKGFTLELFKRVVEGLKILKSVEDINLRHNNIDDTYADQIC